MGSVVSRRPMIVANGMLRAGTPVEFYEDWGLWVKREDKSCLPPGPQFSKARGVYAHVLSRPEELIGVLDTRHSQAGHAVARACQVIPGKRCLNFYPDFKKTPGPHPSQLKAEELGAELFPLPAGRSAILYHAARKETERRGGYIMPNALKLRESVAETALEVPTDRKYDTVIIPVSSGTIAAGVLKGFLDLSPELHPDEFILHMGYSRSVDELCEYVRRESGYANAPVATVNELYAFADTARPGPTPPWPCNEFYDLKAVRWYRANSSMFSGNVLFWNIG
jgi:hypothetical protein